MTVPIPRNHARRARASVKPLRFGLESSWPVHRPELFGHLSPVVAFWLIRQVCERGAIE
jgi:hypothetical protein